MPEGLAKTTDVVSTNVEPIIHPETPEKSAMVSETPPYDVYSFFSIDPHSSEANDTKIKEAFHWAMKDQQGIGGALNKLNWLETKLGAPKLGQTRLDKLSNWIRIQGVIDDLQQRQEAISG